MTKKIQKLSKVHFKIWNKFLKQMDKENIGFVNDMHKCDTWRWKLSEYKTYVQWENPTMNV